MPFCRFCHITKICLYNFDPLKPHFYIKKLGFTGVYIIFLISALNIDCGYSLEPPRPGGSNGYPQSIFWAEIWKIEEFLSENFHFWVVKFSVYLNRLVFVMMRWLIRGIRTFVSSITSVIRRPRWLIWMRRPTGDQEAAGSTPAEVGNILSWRLIMKYFLRSFSPFRWFKKGSCQFLAKECAQYWLTA